MSVLGHELPDYRIAVVGSGAVGCYYGGKLAQFGRRVHFLMRSDYEVVKKQGLKILSRQGDVHIPNAKAHRSTQEIGPCDLVVIALKATSNAALTELIPPLLHERTMLLTLQNGLGNEGFLAHHFGAERVLGGLCFVCLNRTAAGVVHHLAQGRISMGEFQGWTQPRTHEIASEFKRCGVVCSVDDQLMRARWKKLVWNIPFNGWSIAGGDKDTAELLGDDNFTRRIREQMREVILAARHLGHDLPTSLADQMIESTRRMPAYRPSSLIDFVEGREVELQSIWGEPLKQAREAGFEMPRLEELHAVLAGRIRQRDTA